MLEGGTADHCWCARRRQGKSGADTDSEVPTRICRCRQAGRLADAFAESQIMERDSIAIFMVAARAVCQSRIN